MQQEDPVPPTPLPVNGVMHTARQSDLSTRETAQLTVVPADGLPPVRRADPATLERRAPASSGIDDVQEIQTR